MKQIRLQHNTIEWLKFRNTGIGGSDASAILGKNPYKTNVDLWKEKCQIVPPKEVTNNEAVEYGKKAEQYLRELFKLDYPRYEVNDPKDIVYIHNNGFMFASLDGLLLDKKSGKTGILEIKTSNLFSSAATEKWNGKVPDNYYIQVLHYMAVLNADFAVIKAQLKSVAQNGQIVLKTIHEYFNKQDLQEDINYLVKKEMEFWARVANTTQLKFCISSRPQETLLDKHTRHSSAARQRLDA